MKVLAGVFCALVAALLLAGAAADSGPSDEPRVTVISLTARAPVEHARTDMSGSFFGGRGNAFAGVPLVLQALAEFPAEIVDVDAQGSTLTATDDRGADLSEGGQVSVHREWTGTALSTDRKSVLLDLSLKRQPTAGSREITIKGTLAVERSQGSETVTLPDVPLQVGAPVKAGALELQISSVMVSENYTTIHFRSPHVAWLRKVEFIKAGGEVIETTDQLRRESVRLPNGRQEQTISCSLPVPLAESVTMRMTVARNVTATQTPFTIRARVGL